MFVCRQSDHEPPTQKKSFNDDPAQQQSKQQSAVGGITGDGLNWGISIEDKAEQSPASKRAVVVDLSLPSRMLFLHRRRWCKKTVNKKYIL